MPDQKPSLDDDYEQSISRHPAETPVPFNRFLSIFHPLAPSKPTPITRFLLMALGLVYLLEVLFSFDHPLNASWTPGYGSIVSFGATGRILDFQRGQWYRLFTSTLLHSNFGHFFSNGLALWFAGYYIEEHLGAWWLLAFFGLGGLGGALYSGWMSSATVVSLGASGAIMTLLAASLIHSLKLPKGGKKGRIQFYALRVLVPSLIPLAQTGGIRIDYNGHIGGALAGMVFGFFIYFTWKVDDPNPWFKSLGRILAIATIVCYFVAVCFSLKNYGETKSMAGLLIPMDRIPKTKEIPLSESEKLMGLYPKDPRSHFLLGLSYQEAKDWNGAEKEFRNAIADQPMLDRFYGFRFESNMRVLLAEALLKQKKVQEAKEVVKPVCESNPEGVILKDLKKYNLCGN